MSTEQDKVKETIKKILKVLTESYPEKFSEDGLTQMSVHVTGMFLQMLDANTPNNPPMQ
jgi:hypothetical protein